MPTPVDEAVRVLPVRLRTQLAALAGAPIEAAEVVLTLLPFGYRAALEALGAITASGPDGLRAGSETPSLRPRAAVTSVGLDVIEACAHDIMPPVTTHEHRRDAPHNGPSTGATPNRPL
jgi:hypothetical protein